MLLDILLFLLGLALVGVGGNYLTDGATVIARKMRVSSLVIGLTVVAFGSSAPDLVVCLMSTIRNHSQLALGDVVGANIFDILLVIGIVAVIRPVTIDADMQKKDCLWWCSRHSLSFSAATTSFSTVMLRISLTVPTA